MYANIKIITAKELCGSKAYVVVPTRGPNVKGDEDLALKLFTTKDCQRRFQNLEGATQVWCKSDYSAKIFLV